MPSSAITDFVASCRRLSDDSLTAKDAAVLRKVTEQDMPDRYRIPYPDPPALVAATNRQREEKHLRGIWHELVQHLRDLRYLSAAEFISYHAHKNDILDTPSLLRPVLEAVRRYLEEEREWPELAEIRPGDRPVDLLWLSKHLTTVVTRIGLHTIWDGSSLAPAKYSIGETSVFGRALAFRLRTLRSAEFAFRGVDVYYNGADNEILDELFVAGFSRRGNATSGRIPRGYWTALGNVDTLLTSYVEKKDRKALTLLYQLPPGEGETQKSVDSFRKQDFSFHGANWNTYHQGTSRSVFRRAKRRKEYVNGGLGIRLLQIKLWQAGYYVGAIDGDWGHVSHDALWSFLNDKAEEVLARHRPVRTGRPQPKAARVIRAHLTIVNRKHQVYAADVEEVLSLLKAENNNPENVLHLDSADNDLKRLPDLANVSQEDFDQQVLREEDVGKLYPDNVEHPERRVSFFRRLGGVLIGGLKRVVLWLKEGIKKVLGPVFSFVKMLLRPIRAAIHRFFQGFRYLANFVFGKPLFTETAAATDTTPARFFATKFQLDFDSFTVIPAGFAPGEAGLHLRHVNQMREDMGYFIDSVIWIIKAIGRLTSPGGWVWLGWEMVKAIVRGKKQPSTPVVA